MRNLESMVRDRENPAGDFTALARLMIRTRGNLGEMREAAESDRTVPPRTARIIKAASEAGATVSGNWGEGIADAEIASRAFLEGLRTRSVFDRMIGDMRAVPLRTRAASATTVLVGDGVAEAARKPVSTLTLANHALDSQKVSAIIAMTNELATAGGREAAAFLAAEMRGAVVAGTDGAFLDALIDSASPTPTTAGATADNMRTDLGNMLGEVHVRGGARLYWIMGIGAANGASVLADTGDREMSPTGGTLLGLPALVTDQVATDSLMLINAQEIAGNPGTLRLDAARHASLKMDTEPGSGAQEETSLWQTDSRAIRAEREFGFERLTAEAAALMTSVGWAQVPA